VGATHHNRHASRANGVCDSVSLRDHPRHCANTDEPNFFLLYEIDEFGVGHCAGIAVNQQHFVFTRSQCL